MPVGFKKPQLHVNARGTRGRHFDLAVASLATAINELWSAGVRNIRQMANCLNERGLVASSGGPFSYTTTRRVLRRLRELHLASGPRTLGQAASQRRAGPYKFRPGKPMKISRAALKHAQDIVERIDSIV
jgi:hypothetical protein